MFKQLLTFAMAVILALETPATAYAAGQQMQTVTDNAENEPREGITDIPSSGEQSDSATEPDESNGDETGTPEDNDEGNSGAAEDNDGNEPGTSEDNDGNEPGTSEDGKENETGTPEDNGEDGTGSSDENNGSETNPSEDGSGNEDNSSDENDGEETDSSDVTEEDENIEESDEDGDTQENAKGKEPIATLVSSSDITDLDYEKAVSDGIEIAAPYSNSNAAWYSFTAPKAGRYLFYTDGALSYDNNDYTYVNLYTDPNGSYRQSGYYYDGSNLNLATDYMKADETIYLEVYSEAAEGKTFTLKIAEQTTLSKVPDEAGSYAASLGNGIDIAITLQASYRYLQLDAQMTGDNLADTSYYLYYYYQNIDSNYSYYTQNYLSFVYENHVSRNIRVDTATTYDTYYVLRDSSTRQVIAFLGGTDFLTTDSTEDGIIIHDEVICGDNSITMNIEPIADEYMYCYYAPADGSEAEKNTYLSGWSTKTFTDLKSGTEYTFRFYDSYKTKIYATVTYKTTGEAPSAQAAYKADISEDFQKLTLTADISAYTGAANYAYLNYQYSNALGVLTENREYNIITKDTDGNFTLTATLSNPAMLADGVYPIKMWVEFPTDHMTTMSETVKLETPSASYSADDITFTCKQNESTDTMADYEVAIESLDNTGLKNAILYYRPKNSGNTYSSININFSDGKASGSITSLTAGISYEFVLFVGGVRKDISVNLTKTKGISLTQVSEGLNEVNVYDIVRTFRAEALDSETTLADSYYLRLYYSADGKSFNNMGYVQLNADGNYQATVYSAALNNTAWLQPDTDYYLRWELGTSSYSGTVATLYETIHTKSATINLTVEKSGPTRQSYRVTLAAEDVVNMKENKRSITYYAYMKKEDDSDYQRSNKSCYLSYNNEYSSTLSLTELEAETSYHLSLRNNDGSVIYASAAFTTPADERAVAVAIDKKITTATINCSLSGTSSDEGGYLFCYIREKGKDTWNSEGNIWLGSSRYSFSLYGLTENTTYEYTIGFGNNYDTAITNLEKAITGEFTTLADQRSLSDDQTEASVTNASAKLKAYFSGNIENQYTYILFFYKEQTDTNWVGANDYVETNAASRYCTANLTNLKRGTKYDYAIVLSDNYDDLQMSNTPDLVTKDGWKLTGSFMTPKAVAPESISLSESKLYLNAAFPNDEGYGYRNLKVTPVPAAVTKDYAWVSSDESVATVVNGRVTAAGVGTATITVTSLYPNEAGKYASATCEVEVADYRIGYHNGDELVFWEGIQLTKGCSLNGSLALYNFKTKEDYEKVSDAEYTISSNNTSVVSITDGTIYAGIVGNTKLIFTTGEFRAYLQWDTSADVKGFGVIGFTSGNHEYPAIKNDKDNTGNDSYTLAQGISYTAMGEVSPSGSFNPSEFTWISSDTSVATVSYGVITALKAGTTTLTVKANPDTASKDGWAILNEQTVTIVLNIVNKPNVENQKIYALANTQPTLGDVKAPDGWQWKDEDLNTPLVTNGVNREYYSFNAVYNKEGFYPYETTFDVYMAKVTGVSVNDDHAQVVEVSGSDVVDGDAMKLTVTSGYQGMLKTDEYTDYTVDIPSVSGLEISGGNLTESGSRTFTITAAKAGTYTLKPKITVKDKNGNTKQLAQTSYKIKAVADKQVKSIEITPLIEGIDGIDFDKTANRISIDLQSANEVVVSESKMPEQFDVEAIVKDRNGEVFDTAQLIWKSSDAKVAAVKASTDTTQKATVTIKGEGHAILTATAKDAAGRFAKLQIEIRNHAPRVDVSKVNVNTAYDYDSSYGRQLAYNSSGRIEIVPVYNEYFNIGDVTIYENNNQRSDLSAYRYNGNDWVICSDGTTEPGTYNCELRVRVSGSGTTVHTYKYPLKVTVVNKEATVKAKSGNTVNLFYISEKPRMNLTVSGTCVGVQNVLWEDESTGNGNGFAYNGSVSYNSTYKAYSFLLNQESIKLNPNGNSYTLDDAGIAKGKLKVQLRGYKNSYDITNVSIKWNYKKPTIVTQAASTALVPSAKMNTQSFSLWNKTDGARIYYNPNSTEKNYYNEIEWDNEDVALTTTSGSSGCSYTYSGNRTSGSEKITLTLSSDNWRESLTAIHTMKISMPTAALAVSQVTLNTTQIGAVTTGIYLKNNGRFMNCDDIVIEGKDAKAKALLDNDSLVITGYANRITVKQNRATTMGQDAIKAGTYTYKVTPYYTDAAGERRQLNVLTLKVKVVNKAITATTKAKGTLDLTNNYAYYVDNDYYNNYVELTPVFGNIGVYSNIGGYHVTDVELLGEYSDYFTLYSTSIYSLYWGYCRLKIADYGNLKAGQKYKLAVKYTIQMEDGDTFTVTGKAFTVKPKQTAPKITVTNNNQTLYAAADDVSRSYTLKLPSVTYKSNGYSYNYYPYYVEGVSGSLDCNKDGKTDIQVTMNSSGNQYCYLTVKITDRDGVLTTTGSKGKTYSIPVTVRLKGRDGISKDVKTTIKVTVKR